MIMKQSIRFKFFLASLVALLVSMNVNAHDAEIDGIYYNFVTKAKQAIVTYRGEDPLFNYAYSGSVTIPSTVVYEGVTYDVTSVGNSAFQICPSLTSLNIPESVTSIGEWAFGMCSRLSSVNIPSSVKSIDIGTFDGCTALTSIIIPSSVTIIRNAAFKDCSGLASVTIPSSVRGICYKAFEGCTALTSVTIPSSVSSIDENAFYGCRGLTSVTFEGKVYIDKNAFSGCSRLTSIILNGGTIRTNTFANCPELTDIYCYSENPPSVESNAFEGSYIDYVTLHVPAEYIDNYKNNSFWGNSFKEIVAIDPNSVVMPKVEGESPVAYDLNGHRVTNPTSGLYIVNGKKVYVK